MYEAIIPHTTTLNRNLLVATMLQVFVRATNTNKSFSIMRMQLFPSDSKHSVFE